MLKASALFFGMLAFCGGLACGGGSGSDRGSGGTPGGTGGAAAGSGGTTAGTGGTAAGSGGAGGSTGVGYACKMALAPNMAITDFTDGVGTTGRWGTAPTSFTGGIFSYANTGGSLVTTLDATAHNLHLAGSVTGYAGGGLYFDQCTDATGYTGVQFTVAGNLGGCMLELQVQTNSDKKVEASGMKGTCVTGCTSPSAKVLTAPGTITVHWTDLIGGTPSPFSSNGIREIDGLQWQLTSATTCSPDITIDSVAWTK